MATDWPVDRFIKLLGHDGSEIINQLPDPLCRRGHHVQECVAVLMSLGYSATPFEVFPQAASVVPGQPSRVVHYLDRGPDYNWSIFRAIVANERGVITGVGRSCHHAVAFERGRIFDPDGRSYPYSRSACEDHGFYTQAAWRVVADFRADFTLFARADDDEYEAAAARAAARAAKAGESSEGQQGSVGSAEDGAAE